MSFIKITGLISALKLLLLPAYRSTDFEVHRNWLAITHSLPLKQWYVEDTSEWTLDYPPLFAWLEWLLSQVAVWCDPGMLVVSNLNYASYQTVLFQRLSVIVTDLMLAYSVKEYCCNCLPSHKKGSELLSSPAFTLFCLLVTNIGLLLVDHIHFQYNGLLFGVLLLSIVRIYQGRALEGSFWFAVLLNMKHIYLYVAPAYFICLLRNYCLTSNKDGSIRWRSFSVGRLFALAFIVLSVFAASFGPFAMMGQVPQVLSRLFPFKRGLCHAYWAPNFWALYNMADKAATFVALRGGLISGSNLTAASMTGGLVQEFQHTALPSISPPITLIATAMSIIPSLTHLWFHPSGSYGFLRSLTLCAFGSYMFGWHVHEKAILLVTIPLTLMAFNSKRDAQVFVFLSTVGNFSLFPLIFTQPESLIKYSLWICYTIGSFTAMSYYWKDRGGLCRLPLLTHTETIYLALLLPLELYCSYLHHVLGLEVKLPFLPLLLTSVYCALGVTYSWLNIYWFTITDNKIKQTKIS